MKSSLKRVIFYDLHALKDCFYTENEEDFIYHFELLKGNLQNHFKLLKVEESLHKQLELARKNPQKWIGLGIKKDNRLFRFIDNTHKKRSRSAK